MAADMVALYASLYIGHCFSRVLEATFTPHLAVPSLPVPTNCHSRDSSSSPQFALLGNVVRQKFVVQRFGGVVHR